MKILYLDVESLVVHKLIQHQRNGPQLTDEWRLGLHFLSDLFLLFLVQQQLSLVLVLIPLHNDYEYKYNISWLNTSFDSRKRQAQKEEEKVMQNNRMGD